MANMDSKLSTQVDELNPKEIFAEISSEIGVDKQSYTPRQKTRLNYTYVILLNIILIVAVSFGVFAVYRIFREEGIKMTEGTGGIQSLEVLLLEQESRRQAVELQAKEAQLREAQQTLAQIENELARVRSDIQQEVSSELNRQRMSLEERVQRELQGKSTTEQQAIRTQYQQDLQRLQEEAQQEINRRVNEIENNRQREVSQQQAEQQRLQRDLAALTERLRIQEQTIATQVQPTPIIQNVYDDSGVSLLFSSVETLLRQGNYNEVERQLQRIETIYRQPAPEAKKAADMFLITLIRDYIKVTDSNRTLLAELMVATNKGANQNGDMARFRATIEEIANLVKQNPQDPVIARRIRTLQEENPEAFTFYNAYHTYKVQDDVRKATPLIRQAEQAYTRRNYPQAISIYQNILSSHPNIPNQQTVLDGLYRALQAQSTGEQNVYTNTTAGDIVYMKAPDGYVYDMGERQIIVSLLPGIAMKPRTPIRIFRVDPKNGFQLSLIGSGTVIEGKGSFVSAQTTNVIRLGDLVYIAK